MQEIGVRHCTFPSASFDCEVAYCIYLPPGYSDDGPALPVIYNLHGAGGNEFHSFDDVVNLHEGIVAGHYPPAIVVLPNGVRAALSGLSHRLLKEVLQLVSFHSLALTSRCRASRGTRTRGTAASRPRRCLSRS